MEEMIMTNTEIEEIEPETETYEESASTENSAGSAIGVALLLAGGAAAYAVVDKVAIPAGKKAIGWMKGKFAEAKTKKAKKGTVVEVEAEEVTEETQEETNE